MIWSDFLTDASYCMFQVKFDPKHPGIFIGKLYVYATPVVTDGVELRDDDVVPSIVHIEAIAELPDVEVSVLIVECIFWNI